MANIIRNAKIAVYNAYKSGSEYVMGPQTTSTFAKNGKLTPDEFVLAGDYLVKTCPTWSWEAGNPASAKPFLPSDKQYLVTRGVPCLERASTVEQYQNMDESLIEAEDGEGWLATAVAPHEPKTNADGFEEIPTAAEELAGPSVHSEDDIPDIADLQLESAPPQQVTAADAAEASGVLKTRTYDLMISYDTFHAVPRFWLVGYNEDRNPLTEAQIREDICHEHYKKTVTLDPFPHSSSTVPVVSIHPCKHDDTMHKLSQVVAGEGQEFNLEHYMVLFLKFISSVVPTIEYDYTMAAGGI